MNYYYEDDGTRLVSESKRTAQGDSTSEDMSNTEIVKPPPAGTKEEADYVPSLNIRSVRDMFERNKDVDTSPRDREPPPKRQVEVKKVESQSGQTSEASPEVNTEVIKSATAGAREEPEYQASIDLKSARSIFESQKVENYVPRNTIRAREEEAKRQRAAAAAASPRSSESSEASNVDVRSSDAGSKESPEYQVDLKEKKKLFEGGHAPDPVRRETSITRPKRQEVKGDVIRPEPAGTKEIVQFEKSSDLLSAKNKFQNQQSTEEESKRREPIDIQEEKRSVMQKEQEIKEETQQSPEEVNEQAEEEDSAAGAAESESQTKDSPSPSPERRHSVSSEELESKDGVEDEACERLQNVDGHEQQPVQDETEHIVADSVVDTSETTLQGQGQDLIAENVSDEKGEEEEEVCSR